MGHCGYKALTREKIVLAEDARCRKCELTYTCDVSAIPVGIRLVPRSNQAELIPLEGRRY